MSKQIIISSIFFRPPTPVDSCLRSCFAVSVFYGLTDAGEMFMFSLVHCIMFFFAFVLFRNFMPSVDYSSNVYWHGYGLLGGLIKSNKMISRERKVRAKQVNAANIQFAFTRYSLTRREMEKSRKLSSYRKPTRHQHVWIRESCLHESQHSLNLSTVSMMFCFCAQKCSPVWLTHLPEKCPNFPLMYTMLLEKAFSVGEEKQREVRPLSSWLSPRNKLILKIEIVCLYPTSWELNGEMKSRWATAKNG